MAKQFEDFDANLAGEEGKTEETKASWFKRIKKGINTKTSEKKETPEEEKEKHQDAYDDINNSMLADMSQGW